VLDHARDGQNRLAPLHFWLHFLHVSAGLDGPQWGRSPSARRPANGAFGLYMACLLKRGTEESNLEQGFWRPPCYRYTSPPKAQSIRFAGLLCMFGMWRRPSSCVSRVRPAAASRDQGYPRQRSGTTPRPTRREPSARGLRSRGLLVHRLSLSTLHAVGFDTAGYVPRCRRAA
jgi:hypothetical protein